MNILTGRTGEPHVTAKQFRQLLSGIVTNSSAVLPVDSRLEINVVNNNTIRIHDGAIIHNGCVSVVEHGTYDEIKIENGEQGKLRRDAIVLHYEKSSSGIESVKWLVKKGTPVPDGSYPRIPTVIEGNLQDGDLVDELIFGVVDVVGINIAQAAQSVSKIGKIEDMQRQKVTCRTGTTKSGNKFIITKYPDGIMELTQEARLKIKFTEPSGGNYIGKFDLGEFAESFLEKPTLVSIVNESAASAWYSCTDATNPMTATKAGGVYFYRETRVENDETFLVSFTVKGRCR